MDEIKYRWNILRGIWSHIYASRYNTDKGHSRIWRSNEAPDQNDFLFRLKFHSGNYQILTKRKIIKKFMNLLLHGTQN